MEGSRPGPVRARGTSSRDPFQGLGENGSWGHPLPDRAGQASPCAAPSRELRSGCGIRLRREGSACWLMLVRQRVTLDTMLDILTDALDRNGPMNKRNLILLASFILALLATAAVNRLHASSSRRALDQMTVVIRSEGHK